MGAKFATGEIIQINTEGLDDLKQALLDASEKSLNECWRVLKTSGAEFHRRLQRITPVEFGRLRASWVMLTERDDTSMEVQIGTSLKSDDGQPYAVYLEMGTERIAGGKVMAWVEGQEPILEWPAKMRDLPNFRLEQDKVYKKTIGGVKKRFITEYGAGKEGTAKFERSVKTSTKAMSSETGEQMPMIRPLAYELGPRIVEALIRTLHEGLEAGLDGKEF